MTDTVPLIAMSFDKSSAEFVLNLLNYKLESNIIINSNGEPARCWVCNSIMTLHELGGFIGPNKSIVCSHLDCLIKVSDQIKQSETSCQVQQ